MAHDAIRPGSLVIHGGQAPEPVTGAVMPPVFLTSTYAQPSPGQHAGFEYTRSHNPTRYALERCLAALERSPVTQEQDASLGGFAFASGMAAIGTVLELIDTGSHVVAMDDLYGGTHRLFRNVRERSAGLSFTFADMSVEGALEAAVTDETRLIWVESPSNPMLKIVDLEAISAFARERGILCACDNTFATPMLQQPLTRGFDLVVHSVTKYLGGHSDVVGGAIVAGSPELAERVRFLQNSVGSVLGPFDSYLTLRGIKTLALRMRQHCASGAAVAAYLERHPKVKRVVYPTHPSHPQHEVAMRSLELDGAPAGGGMVTIFLEGGLEGSRRFLEALRMFQLAESLGGVESLVDHPAIMTHASVPAEMRAKLGVTDDLVRLSVGIEDLDDLLADLERALDAV